MEDAHKNDTHAQSSAGSLDIDEQLTTSCRHYFDQKIVFKPASKPDSYLERLKSNYRPLNPMPERNTSPTKRGREDAKPQTSHGDHDNAKDGIPSPKRVLYDPAQVEMKWSSHRGVGSGLSNMGNTCFLNSVLQCLTYTPPLYNYLVSDHHKRICRGQGFCAMCELQRHVQRVINQSGGIVKPVAIVQSLRVVGKHFRPGRQEDAHEFLRYFVDGLQKSSLQGVSAHLDPQSKATTIIHQVFGGYHCSQVRCTECMKTSETFDPLLDLSLDIKNCSTLVQALTRFTKPDSLEGDNQYACPFCKKMTSASKRFTIHRLPNILTIQLKRFDYNSLFGGKINKPVSYPHKLDMRPFTTLKKGPPQCYQLYGVLVHSGHSCRSGHYYCYIQSSNRVWHCLNDAQVYQVSANQVLQQEAYLLFYARDSDQQSSPAAPRAQCQPLTPTNSSLTTTSSHFKNTAEPPLPSVRPDPNFLGQPVKRSPHVDKTGTLYVKIKPTGIVPPSPQETSVSPTQASRNFTHPANTIPLRKSDVDPTPRAPPPPPVVEPPKPNIFPVKKPSFLPRVIAAPSSKKKKLQVMRLVGPKTDKLQETSITDSQSESTGDKVGSTSHEEERRDCQDRVSKDLSLVEQGNIDPVSQSCEVFIGPCLPQTSTDTAAMATPTQPQTTSPKIARVQPQPKPGKPVALVHPVVPDTPKKVSKVTHIKGLAGEQHTNKNQQVVRPTWKPVGVPSPATSPATTSTATTSTATTSTATTSAATTSSAQEAVAASSTAGQKSDSVARMSESAALTPPPKVKKRKKHKKKKSHKTDEEREDSERERRHHRVEEKNKKHSTHYNDEDSDEDERPRKKRKTPQHESWKERKRSRHDSHRRREYLPSNSSSSSEEEKEEEGSERGRYRHGSGRKRGREDREGRRHESSHRDGRKHESSYKRHEGKQCQSSGSSHSLHKSRHESPSPDRSKRKRHWSSDTDDSHGRHKSLKHESHHVQKKHHSSEHHHHHKHHDKGRKSKHTTKSAGNGASGSDSKYLHHRSKHEPESECDGERDSGRQREVSVSHNVQCSEGQEGRNGKRGEEDVPKVEWDSALRGEGRRGQAVGQWDGSRGHNVVDILTSHTPNELGTKVKSWEGGANSVDASAVPGEWKRKERDKEAWDQQLDRGKVKHSKNKRESEFPSKNPFQEFQNKKNALQTK